jgi:hypothetical protein
MTELVAQYDYHYDAQMKRYLQQIVKAFSGWQYETGRTINGKPERRIVPCRMASKDRMVAQIMRGGENTLLTVPIITVQRTGLTRKPGFDGSQTFSSVLHVAERAKDAVTGRYTSDRGQSYTIERLMPIAFDMTIQIDIWTSNENQKDQLLEQILGVAGREFDIQNSDNIVDWSALTTMQMTDLSISSRSIPIGTEDDIDVATINYTMPFLLNPPAKITRQVLIQEVRTNIDTDSVTGAGKFVQQTITPNDYRIAVQKGVITLCTNDDVPVEWTAFENVYRTKIVSGVSQMRLKKTDDEDAAEIVGLLYATDDPTQKSWQIDIDTLPANTLPPVNGIVRPLEMSPGNGLPQASNGQRYIVYEDVGTSQSWGTVNARTYDIIEYRNNAWIVTTSASAIIDATVLNMASGTQLRGSNRGWEKAIDGLYLPGHWRILS